MKGKEEEEEENNLTTFETYEIFNFILNYSHFIFAL